MDKARPPMGLDGKSSQKTGAEQAEEIWKLAHPVENLDNRNKNASTVPVLRGNTIKSYVYLWPFVSPITCRTPLLATPFFLDENFQSSLLKLGWRGKKKRQACFAHTFMFVMCEVQLVHLCIQNVICNMSWWAWV